MLGAYTNKPVPSAGSMTPTVIVIHRGENPPGNGSALANYCYYGSPSRYRWHWSVGTGGQKFKHLDWTEEGVHAAGLNGFAAGIEQDGRSYVDPWPEEQLRATAQITADFCHFVQKAPSRTFIIGHGEDSKYGGTSTHTDPGPAFPWARFMQMVNEEYGTEDEDVANAADRAQFNVLLGEANALKAGGKLVYDGPIPKTFDEYDADEAKFKGLWSAVGKARVA